MTLPKRQQQVYDMLLSAGRPVKARAAAFAMWAEDPSFPINTVYDLCGALRKKGLVDITPDGWVSVTLEEKNDE